MPAKVATRSTSTTRNTRPSNADRSAPVDDVLQRRVAGAEQCRRAPRHLHQIQLPEPQWKLKDFAVDSRAQLNQPAMPTRFAREVTAAVSIGNHSASTTGPLFVNGSRGRTPQHALVDGHDQWHDCRHFGSNCAADAFRRHSPAPAPPLTGPGEACRVAGRASDRCFRSGRPGVRLSRHRKEAGRRRAL
jgi:hypothetical protein